jgi:hypothetical protein
MIQTAADLNFPHPEKTASAVAIKNMKACTILSGPEFSQKEILGKVLLGMACRAKTTTAHKM